MILITKRTKCGIIGKHIIYTIKDTVIIRVCEPSVKSIHPLEQRYLRIFTSVDLRSNFYFSYSYDLTRTLQHNLSAPKHIGKADIENDEPLPDWNKYVRLQHHNQLNPLLLTSEPIAVPFSAFT